MQTTSNQNVTEYTQLQGNARQLLELVDGALENVRSAHSDEEKLHELIDGLANRERELQGLLRQLRRVLPATYFRTNSRVYRVTEEIKKVVNANEEAAFSLHDWSREQQGTNPQSQAVLESLQTLRARLQQSLS